MSGNKLGLFSIVLLGINAIVGTGIFLLPNQAYAEVGVMSIGVIIFDAFLVISIALCFAEMGGMYKNNGGPYLYAKDAFGEFVGFEVGIMKWAISIIAWAAMAMGFPTALGAVWAPAQNPLVQKVIAILGASLATTSTPVATAAEKFLGKWAGAMVTAGTLISIGGINVASSFLTPRAGVAMSDENQLPSFISKRNSKDVPYVAVIISVVLTALVTLTGSFTTLAAISVVSRFAQYIPTCLAVPVMRKKAPDMERGFTLPLGPVIPIIAIVVSLWLLSQSDLKKIIFGLGGLVVGAIIYFIMKLSNKR